MAVVQNTYRDGPLGRRVTDPVDPRSRVDLRANVKEIDMEWPHRTMSETDAENVWVVLMEKERYSSTTYGAPKLKKLAKITPKLLFTKARWGMNSIEKGRAVWKLFDDEADARAFYDELMERTRWMEIHDEIAELQKRVQECRERQTEYATREATNHDHGWYFLPDEA